ncbi:MAG: TIGR00730 family Rossman fold protein [Lentisphaeria bacterium]
MIKRKKISPDTGIHSVAVYLGSGIPKDVVYTNAVIKLGEFLVKNDMTLVFGGSAMGMMKVLADVVLSNGGKVVGVFTKNISMKYLHPGLTESVVMENLAERKAEMIRRADAIVAMPGSFGTLDELFDAISQRKIPLGGIKTPIGVLNIEGYYDLLLEFVKHTVDIGFTTPAQEKYLCVGKTPEELFAEFKTIKKPE